VRPDIAVPVDRAFSTAYRELLGVLLAQTNDPLAKAELQRAVANSGLDIGRPSGIFEGVAFHPLRTSANASPPRAPRISLPTTRDRGD
jgi:hypothetical protein